MLCMWLASSHTKGSKGLGNSIGNTDGPWPKPGKGPVEHFLNKLLCIWLARSHTKASKGLGNANGPTAALWPGGDFSLDFSLVIGVLSSGWDSCLLVGVLSCHWGLVLSLGASLLCFSLPFSFIFNHCYYFETWTSMRSRSQNKKFSEINFPP